MQKDEAPRLTVTDAIRLVSEFIKQADGKQFPDEFSVYVEVRKDEAGNEVAVPNGRTTVERIDGKDRALASLRASFKEFCRETGTRPRNLYNRWHADSYTGGHEIEDYQHDISHDEFLLWAAAYGYSPAASSTPDPEAPVAEPSDERERKVEQRADAIIKWLVEHDYDPMNLPPFKHNEGGAKAEVKAAIGSARPDLRFTDSGFKKAWEYLSLNGRVKYAGS